MVDLLLNSGVPATLRAAHLAEQGKAGKHSAEMAKAGKSGEELGISTMVIILAMRE